MDTVFWGREDYSNNDRMTNSLEVRERLGEKSEHPGSSGGREIFLLPEFQNRYINSPSLRVWTGREPEETQGLTRLPSSTNDTTGGRDC